jgi:hypothetical protein
MVIFDKSFYLEDDVICKSNYDNNDSLFCTKNIDIYCTISYFEENNNDKLIDSIERFIIL